MQYCHFTAIILAVYILNAEHDVTVLAILGKDLYATQNAELQFIAYSCRLCDWFP